ncbi:6-phosphogluconolactonase [Spirulina sp. CS-785/01]|uniref:6-phosphogluconolactonase n=1 Tax=Spirulina sp. CS-785/01 TaxID=3021716 RepID=UPI00232CFBDD|nr:6-phosphogluconolactonase [Spirulina sp. CS-785/01]MDB9313992.1 6-phosphogluconolactonase [Spirulina sp. CS-785/01]
MERKVEILADKGSLVHRACELVVERIEAAIAAYQRCTIALAGGSTPKPLYEALATQDLPWDKIHVFWGDERYVPHDHPDSNYKMAREAWLDRVNFPETNIHPMPTQAGNPQADADQHNQELQNFFQGGPRDLPALDVILLGMGDDGHTASLFPHTEVLQVCDRLVAVGNKDGQPRLTFTIPLLNQARCVLFLVAGANKQNALQQVFAESGDNIAYPSRFIQPQGECWWLLDEAAGQGLEKS